jgi:LPS-assembly lipoprotein
MVWIVCLIVLGGCGFSPVYGPQSSGREFMSSIAVSPPVSNRTSYLLVAALEERLGRNDAGSLLLWHNVSLGEAGLGVSARIHVTGAANYRLTQVADGTEVAKGRVESFTAYSRPFDQSNFESARQDAIKRLISILADKIVTDIIASEKIGANPSL